MFTAFSEYCLLEDLLMPTSFIVVSKADFASKGRNLKNQHKFAQSCATLAYPYKGKNKSTTCVMALNWLKLLTIYAKANPRLKFF